MPGLGKPEGDLPPERFWERVDGAADALVAAGCTRLLFWKSAHPPADAEILLFARAEGAAGALARDAGPERTPGPGDEGSVSDQAIYFRRGRAYVRILLDPRAPPDRAALLALARNMDSVLPALSIGSQP